MGRPMQWAILFGVFSTTSAVSELSRMPSPLMQACLFSLSMIEGADNALLGASQLSLIRDLGITFDDINDMNIVQGVATNLFGIMWGISADRRLARRKDLLTVAAIGQGIVTILLSFTYSFGAYMFILRFFNGLFLSGIRPIVNGVIAEKTSEDVQGMIFSRAQVAFLTGLAVVNWIVTPMSPVYFNTPLSDAFEGWRLGWMIIGVIAIVAAAITSTFMVEEKQERVGNEAFGAMMLVEVKLLGRFLRMPTFLMMVGQGVFGTIPWTVLWYQTSYFIFCGMEPGTAGLLVGLNPVSGSLGTLMGGYIADGLAERFGFNGRPLNAQISVMSGIPFLYLTLVGIPPGDGSFGLYLATLVAFNLMSSWAQGGTNFPTLSQIVPADVRSRVLAVEGAAENSLAVILGSRAVTFISQNIYGFNLNEINVDNLPNYKAASALGLALFTACAFPWLMAFTVYSFLHWTFPRDRKILLAELAAEAAEKGETVEMETVKSTFSSGQYTSGRSGLGFTTT